MLGVARARVGESVNESDQRQMRNLEEESKEIKASIHTNTIGVGVGRILAAEAAADATEPALVAAQKAADAAKAALHTTGPPLDAKQAALDAAQKAAEATQKASEAAKAAQKAVTQPALDAADAAEAAADAAQATNTAQAAASESNAHGQMSPYLSNSRESHHHSSMYVTYLAVHGRLVTLR
jgi:hypothetical protein